MSKQAVSAYPWNYPQRCKALVNRVEQEIEILSGPKGMLNYKVPYGIVRHFRQYFNLTSSETESYKDLWLDAFKNDWGFGADFVIFKVLKSERTNCLRVSEREVFEGSHYILSYPGRTSFSDTNINHSLYLSTGVVYQSEYFYNSFISLKDTTYRYLNSSLEAYPGSSGAGLVSE